MSPGTSMPLELPRYDEQVARIHKQLHDLIQERDSLIYYAAGCGSLFAPIRRVPNELLVEIFAMASQPSRISEGTPQEEPCRLAKQDLLHLSQVCSHWNHVVMETPMLWSNIAVDFDLWFNSPASPDTLRGLLESSLRRGGNFPLQISLYAGDDARQLQWGLELLSQHSHRWRRVSLQLDLSFLEFISSVHGRLPLLEELAIDGWDEWPDDLDIFAVAPRLKAATLEFHAMTNPLLLNFLPWEQLMNIEFRNFRTAKLPRLFPVLARLPIGAVISVDRIKFSHEIVHHQN